MSIKQENSTAPPPPPRETPTASPPPRETNLSDGRKHSLINSLRPTYLTLQETETRLQSFSNLMTSSEEEDAALFQEVISKLTGNEIRWMASLLIANFDHYFLEIARNRNGSILRHFFHVMTDKEASYAAIHGMRVFNQKKKMEMYDQILHHAIPLARDRYGSIKLRAIISDDDFVYCRNHLLGIIAFNALLLSYDGYGNFLVQQVLRLNILRCTYDIAVSLRGHYVELSFTHGGRYIVEKLLEREETGVLVVAELLECERGKLSRLARSVYGNFVVEKALKVARGDLFRGLVNKLKPFLPLLRTLEEGWINCSQKGLGDRGSFEEENENITPPRKNPQQPFIIEELSDSSSDSNSSQPRGNVTGEKVTFISLLEETASSDSEPNLSLGIDVAVPSGDGVFTRNVTYRGKNKTYAKPLPGIRQGSGSQGTNVVEDQEVNVAKDLPECEILGKQ
ncbi:hypothetical protein Bca52824_036238 [Brassica carinata]|uniref:PUM-HD domain-containing protein n=1 Tax=Brassica carinata TaxID=52824 RepID=A0A8X7V4T2_BRACI|nr:hypothetical protein Bca52824_036238 [Brassica carinata]